MLCPVTISSYGMKGAKGGYIEEKVRVTKTKPTQFNYLCIIIEISDFVPRREGGRGGVSDTFFNEVPQRSSGTRNQNR